MRRPPRVIEPAANRLVDLCGRQPEFFAMRVAHNSRSCRLLQSSWSPLLGSDPRRIGYQPIALPRSKAALLLAGVLWLHLGKLASKALPLSYTPTGARRAGVSPVRKAMKSAGTSSKPLAAPRFDRSSPLLQSGAVTRPARKALRIGSADGIRTHDPPLDRRILLPLSYCANIESTPSRQFD